MLQNPDNIKVGIIGAGKAGSSLARHFESAGKLLWVSGQTLRSLAGLYEFVPEEKFRIEFKTIEKIPDIIILAVPDSAIEIVAGQIAGIFGKKLKNSLIIHLSGTLGKEALSACTEVGACVAACHPFQTFYKYREDVFAGVGWGIDCFPEYKDFLDKFIRSTGGLPHFFTKDELPYKPLYHLSAVAAANYLTAVLQFGIDAVKKTGLPPETFIPKIAQTALVNNVESILKDDFPLTGPIARGDTVTISKHLEILNDFPEMLDFYKNTGLATAGLALEKGVITKEKFLEIKKIISEF